MVWLNKINIVYICNTGAWWLVSLVITIPLVFWIPQKAFCLSNCVLEWHLACFVYSVGWFVWSNSCKIEPSRPYLAPCHIWLNLFYVEISLCGSFQLPILFDASIFFRVTSQQKLELRAHWSIMGKRSYKQAARSEKDNTGCMWGLISMFDFRRGHSNQKLLSDKKHRCGRHVGKMFFMADLKHVVQYSIWIYSAYLKIVDVVLFLSFLSI